MRSTYVHTYFPSNDNHRDRCHRSRRQSNCGSVPLCSLLQDNNVWIICIHSIISVSINRDATLFHWLHTFPEHCAYILVKDAYTDCLIWFRIELQSLSKYSNYWKEISKNCLLKNNRLYYMRKYFSSKTNTVLTLAQSLQLLMTCFTRRAFVRNIT